MEQEGFRGPQVCSIVGITYRQLDHWDRTGLSRPSLAQATGSGSQRLYSYRDLLELKVIKQLLDGGVNLRQARRAIECLRESVGDDLTTANLVLAGEGSVLVRTGEEIIDLLRGGQGVFNVVPLAGVVGRGRRRHPRDRRTSPDARRPACRYRRRAVAPDSGRSAAVTAGRGRLDAPRAGDPARRREALTARARCGSPTTPSACSPSCSTSTRSPGSTSRSSSCSPGVPTGSRRAPSGPDFYLSEHGLFLELTTLRQELVTVKNRKLRQMAELYPEVQVRVLYRRDVFGLIGSTCPRQRLDWPGEPPTHPACTPSTELGARLVDFGGWEMPLSYPDGTIAEHLACRTDAAVFDVSHLGTVRVTGPGRSSCCRRTSPTTSTRSARAGRSTTHLLDEEDASVLDDIIVWWVGEDRFDVMPNASNTDRVIAVLGGEDVTERAGRHRRAGPDGRASASRLSSPEAAAVGHFAVATSSSTASPCRVAGTGYTGEDGVECAVPAEIAAAFWRAVVGAGVKPAGTRRPRHPPPRSRASRCTATSSAPGITSLQAGPRLGRRLGQGAVPWTRASGGRTGCRAVRRLRGLAHGRAAGRRERRRRPRRRQVAAEVVRAATSRRCCSAGIALGFLPPETAMGARWSRSTSEAAARRPPSVVASRRSSDSSQQGHAS